MRSEGMTASLKCPTCGQTKATFGDGMSVAFLLMATWFFGFVVGWVLR